MLGIVSVRGAGLDAGSVGLLMGRRWSAAGRPSLLIDAGATGQALAERLGSTTKAEYSPVARGLPSLIAAREPLTLKSMADHCWSLDGATGSRWALFAPGHPDGAKYAVRWLSQRAGELMEIDRQRCVIIACSLADGDDDVLPLLKVLPRVALLTPARSRQDAEALKLWCQRSGLIDDSRRGAAPQRAFAVVAGPTLLRDDEIEAMAMLPVAGHLPEIDDKRLLQVPRGSRGRAFMREFDRVSEFCLAISELDAQPASPSTDVESRGA